MAEMKIERVRVLGVASCVPSTVRSVDEVAERFGAEEAAKISESTGVERRRVAQPETCASDLCYAAAEKLLAELGWERDSVGTLIFVSQSPDYFAPATACVLHERLGLGTGCAAFDMNLGCSGYVYGLASAAQMTAGTRGRALLLVGDTITKMVADDDRSTLPLFGDAGSATALEFDPDAAPMTFRLGTDGTGKDDLIVHEGGFRNPPADHGAPNRRCVSMNGAEVFRFALSEVPKLYKRTLADAGWEAADVDGVVMHQSNRFMLEHFRKRLKLAEEAFLIRLKEFGNASCASIPLAINDAWGGPGASVTKRLVLVGFGVGWSWGAVSIEFDGVATPGVIELQESISQQSSRTATTTQKVA